MLDPLTDSATYTLGCFALFCGLAKRFRKAGDMLEAGQYEGYADSAYDRLPEGAQW
jgi:hypothetical protein